MLVSRSNVEQLNNQITTMQENHQRVRDEYERILKELKRENELVNEQLKQHLTEQTSTGVVSRKSSVTLICQLRFQTFAFHI